MNTARLIEIGTRSDITDDMRMKMETLHGWEMTAEPSVETGGAWVFVYRDSAFSEEGLKKVLWMIQAGDGNPLGFLIRTEAMEEAKTRLPYTGGKFGP